VGDRLRDEIARRGPVPFSTFMEAALYDPTGGFYAAGGAGRRRDFLTSAETGPLFGGVLAHALDRWWDELGRPTPFVVVDAGAGPGTLARSVLAGRPACATALRYVMVERSPAQRERQREGLAIEERNEAFVGAVDEEREGLRPSPTPPPGPIVTSLAELPAGTITGVVLANELLDNVPVDLVDARGGRWHEVLVGADGGGFVEMEGPVVAPPIEGLAPVDGARVPAQGRSREWLRSALDLVDRGRVVVIDYARADTAEFGSLSWHEWLRTYRSHARGGSPLDEPGTQDLTIDVAIDQLSRERPPDRVMVQADFLREHGIDEMVEEGRHLWAASAANPDLAALQARSRIVEAEALLDPNGMGGFSVLEWVIPAN
jgi:SAM-dependent MidA family methyltransferase